MGKSDDARAFLVEFGSILLIVPIDASHINQHVDQLRADFVVFHVDGRGVRCYVDLRDDIEQEGLLDLGSCTESIHHRRDECHLRQKFLHNLGQSLIDRVVVDRSELEGERDRLAVF